MTDDSDPDQAVDMFDFDNVTLRVVASGSVMASSAAPADSQARVGPSAEAEHFVDFPIT